MIRIAINGLGRIGRAAFKIILETPEAELVAINDVIPADNLAYLLKYDTAYGRYEKEVGYKSESLIIDNNPYALFSEKDPAKLPWGDLAIDTVFECTGAFTTSQALGKHIQAGAKRVILSAPTNSDDIPTIVPGVNGSGPDSPQIVSCAGCTTNCITPLMEIMGRRIGVKKALMTTVHAYTSSQGLVDLPKDKFRRGRAAAANLVPTSTGAAVATTKVLSHHKGLFDGAAVRVPVPVGSLADLTFLAKRETTAEEVNEILKEETKRLSYQGVLAVSEEPIVSSDIIKDSRASIVDLSMTQVVDGDLVKVMSWYDNEWGYASQMVREAAGMGKTVETPDPLAEREIHETVQASPG